MGNTKKGFYVAIEGIDGSGKTAVINALKNANFGSGVITVRQPGSTHFAEKMRAACLNEELSIKVQTLFYASLLVDCHEKVVTPALDEDKIVISDRGFGTTAVYQGIAQDNSYSTLTFIRTLDVRKPDLTIYLNIPLDVAIERESGDGRSQDRYGSSSYVEKQKIKEGYDLLYGVEPVTSLLDPELRTFNENVRHVVTESIGVVNADAPLDVVVDACEVMIIKAIGFYD